MVVLLIELTELVVSTAASFAYPKWRVSRHECREATFQHTVRASDDYDEVHLCLTKIGCLLLRRWRRPQCAIVVDGAVRIRTVCRRFL